MAEYLDVILYGAVVLGGLIFLYLWSATGEESEHEVDGLEFDVEFGRRTSSYEHERCTRYRFQPPFEIPADLRIENRRMWPRFKALLRRFVGAREVVDDRGLLNQPFIITARDVDRAAHFLRRPGVEAFLLELNSEFFIVTIDDGEIVVEREGNDPSSVIEQTKERLAEQAKAVGSGAPSSRSLALGAQPGVTGVPRELFESSSTDKAQRTSHGDPQRPETASEEQNWW